MSEVEWLDIFSTNLKEIMEEQGYTQRDLANDIGVSESAISNYAKGTKIPGIKVLINMAYEFDISLDDLMDFGDRIN